MNGPTDDNRPFHEYIDAVKELEKVIGNKIKKLQQINPQTQDIQDAIDSLQRLNNSFEGFCQQHKLCQTLDLTIGTTEDLPPRQS